MGQVVGAVCSSDGLSKLMPQLPVEGGQDEADQLKTFHLEPLPGMNQGGKYSGVCLGRDGRLYYCPYEADCVAVYNPETKELGFIHHPRLRGPKKYLGICAGPDGRLYCAPANACNVLVITPGAGLRPEEALSFIDGLGGGEDKYGGICASPSGILCCCPYTSDSALVIDPWTQQFSYIDGVGHGYVGICMAADGLLYCAPFQASRVLVLNLEAEEGRQVSYIEGHDMVGNGRYIGIAAAPNGKLYCAPWNAAEVLAIDPSAQEDKLSFIGGAGEGDAKYHGLCAAADGKLYCAPYRDSRVLVVDPIAERLIHMEEICEERSTFRGICSGASGGWLYVAPWDAPSLLAVKMLSSR